jgi:hypothetical protein
VCTFDLSRSNGQVVGQRALVVQLVHAITQIPVTLSHRGVIIFDAGGLKVGPQYLHEFANALRLQALLLLRHTDFSNNLKTRVLRTRSSPNWLSLLERSAHAGTF